MNMTIAIVLTAASAGIGASERPAGSASGIDAAPIVAVDYSASATHQCRTAGGETHSCVVTGAFFGTCIDADSSLRAQDCCPSTRVCARDAQGRETECRRGGTSSGFAMNYCIPGR